MPNLMTESPITEWKPMAGGTALLFSGKIVGWVTSTTNGKYLSGFKGAAKSEKIVSDTLEKAKHQLLHDFFQANSVGIPT